MAYSKVVSSLLIVLICSLISCVKINAALINPHNQCFRDPSRCFWRIASFCIFSWTSAVVQLNHRTICMHQHNFSWLFQKIETLFRVINYKLRLSCSSMARKKWRQNRNYAHVHFRIQSDTKPFEYAACGRKNFRIRRKIFAEKKISRYVWTWTT